MTNNNTIENTTDDKMDVANSEHENSHKELSQNNNHENHDNSELLQSNDEIVESTIPEDQTQELKPSVPKTKIRVDKIETPADLKIPNIETLEIVDNTKIETENKINNQNGLADNNSGNDSKIKSVKENLVVSSLVKDDLIENKLEKNSINSSNEISVDTTDLKFTDFPIHSSILDALEQIGWESCTPIQAKTLGLSLQGYDIAGKAQTGTGKTAAFLVAMYHYLMTNPILPDTQGPFAMILAPTRELAIQIYENALQIGCYTGLKPVCIYGGKDYESQKSEFIGQQPDVIIGTPGRIIDLFKQRFFSLKNIDVLILDEADRMFDLGFISDIRFLLRQMPEASKRLNLVFSATFNYRVQELAYEHLNAPKLIEVESATETATEVTQSLYHVGNDEKMGLLIGQLQTMHPERSIVFVNTKHVLEKLANTLVANGFTVAALSGDLSQSRREQLLKQFQAGDRKILVATDIAARGLHIDDVTHVFNYDLPQHPEDYIHRIGRTARAGKSGIAISYCCEDYAYHLPDIEDKIGNKIPVTSVTDEMIVEVTQATQVDKDNSEFTKKPTLVRRRPNTDKRTPSKPRISTQRRIKNKE